jgi:hypothetical protein
MTNIRTTIALQCVPPIESRLDFDRPALAVAIERDLLRHAGIAQVIVNVSTEMVYIEFDPVHWNQASLAKVAADAERRAYATELPGRN